MLEKDLIKKITDKAIEIFPQIKSIVLWGSAMEEDFDKELGDVDLVFFAKSLPKTEEVQKGLTKLKKSFEQDGIDCDPAVTNIEGFPAEKSIYCYRTATTHALQHYQIKYMSRVIYGDESVIQKIPDITIEKALEEIAHHILTKAIPEIRTALRDTKGITGYLRRNIDVLFVLVRTLYSLKERSIASKTKAATMLSSYNNSLKNLGCALSAIYRNQEVGMFAVSHDDVELLCKLVEKNYREFLKEAQ